MDLCSHNKSINTNKFIFSNKPKYLDTLIIIIFILTIYSSMTLSLGQATSSQLDTYPYNQPIKGKILFDESHHQFWTACIDNALADYAMELRNQGYQVDRLTEDQGPITYDKLKEYDILAFPNGFVGKYNFNEGVKLLSASEIDAIERFVNDGGGLVLFECGWSWVQYSGLSIDEAPINELGHIFGFTLNDDIIFDPTNYYDNRGDSCPMFYGQFIKPHAITNAISEISNCEGIPSSLTVYDPSIDVLITGDEDAYSARYSSDKLPPFLAVTEYGKGKVVLFGQVGFLTSLDGNGDGIKNIYEFDNLNLGLNIMEWLIGPTINPLSPSISLENDASPASGNPGSKVTFIIKVKNIGENSLDKVNIVDTLPPGMKYINDNKNGIVSLDGKTVSWIDAFQLDPGESETIELNAMVGCSLGTRNNHVEAIAFIGSISDIELASCEFTIVPEATLSWPIDLTELKGIEHVVGDYSAVELHNGIDIVCDKNTPVKASEGGIVEKIISQDVGQSIFIANCQHTLQYTHLNLKNGITKGMYIEKGEDIGTIFDYQTNDNPKMVPHLHFGIVKNIKKEEFPADCDENPILLLNPPFVYGSKPKINEIRFREDDYSYDGGFIAGNLMGKIDIVANVNEDLGAGEGRTAGIYKIQYKIENAETGEIIIGPETSYEWKGDIDHSDLLKQDIVYDTNEYFNHWYIVTNSNYDDEGCWNTRKYNNGKYKITITAWDTRNNEYGRDSREITKSVFNIENIIKTAIAALSPVHLTVIDPQGRLINNFENQINGAKYIEDDIDNDNENDSLIEFEQLDLGYYKIYVTPKPEANLSDTYSIVATSSGNTLLLANDVQIRDIPKEPYIIQVTESGIIRPSIYLEKSAKSNSATPFSKFVFIIKVINSGSVALNNVTITDYLPFGVSYFSDNRSGSLSGRNITWSNLGSLAEGSSISIQVICRIDRETAGTIINKAEANAIAKFPEEVIVNSSAEMPIKVEVPDRKEDKNWDFIRIGNQNTAAFGNGYATNNIDII